MRRKKKVEDAPSPRNLVVATLFGALFEQGGSDYRGLPTTVCPCGYDMFITCVSFDEDRTIGEYLIDGACCLCGSLVTLATEIDFDEGEEYNVK